MDKLDPKYRKLLNHASENLRKEERDLLNANEKRKRAKKEIDIVLKETKEELYSDKFRKAEMADSEEFMEVKKSQEAKK